MSRLQIHYWDHNRELYVEFGDSVFDHSISIKDGRFEIDVESDHLGSYVYVNFLLYDICALIALWQETYGRQDDYV